MKREILLIGLAVFFVLIMLYSTTYIQASYYPEVIENSSNRCTGPCPFVFEKFIEIYKIPSNEHNGKVKTELELYKSNNGNCADKSNAFYTFLKRNGAEDCHIYIGFMPNYMSNHAFVVWQGKVYDTANNYYNYDLSIYKKELGIYFEYSIN